MANDEDNAYDADRATDANEEVNAYDPDIEKLDVVAKDALTANDDEIAPLEVVVNN